MKAAAAPSHDSPETLGTRLRNAAVGAAFVIVLMVPKVLHLRRSPRSWGAFRILLGIAGAALVVVPISLWNSYLLGVAGLAMFIAAILLPPAQPDTLMAKKCRELSAFVVVNGGFYQPGHDQALATHLFVAPEHVWALDSHLRPLVVIPVSEMASAAVEETGGSWVLRVRWGDDRSAEFSYRGFFAEHLARVAESTLHSVMRPSLPVVPQRRAASA
jgi:hypothetical protein